MKIKPVFHYSLFMLALFFMPLTSANAACEEKHIVVLGDSLVAGYGLPPGSAFPEQLENALTKDGQSVKVTNAGVSGDTTSGGLARLDWSVGEDADIVILELGANDALRGIPVEVTRANLEEMVKKLQDKETFVILAGMLAPPNMGAKYGEAFNSIYPDLAASNGVLLYPFFLDGVAADPSLNQSDGIHPTGEGIAEIVKRFLPTMLSGLGEVCSS